MKFTAEVAEQMISELNEIAERIEKFAAKRSELRGESPDCITEEMEARGIAALERLDAAIESLEL